MANDDAQHAEESLEGAEYVTATQALTLLGVGKPKLAQMIREGELPTYPNPRHKQIKRIKVSDIQDWLQRAGPPRTRKPKKLPRSKGGGATKSGGATKKRARAA